MMCIICVDDTILAGPDVKVLEEVIKSLGMSEDEQCHTFKLRGEGEVGDILGIGIEKTGTKKFTITQTELIAKKLKELNMESCDNSNTPPALIRLGKYVDGNAFNESWEYTNFIGMLTYVSTNSRPDIAYAVNQCVRFTQS